MNLFYVRLTIFLLTIVAAVVVAFSLPSIPQPLWYHDFSGSHAANILSNIPLLLVGLGGLFLIRREEDLVDKALWALFFTFVTIASVGSVWYHLQPDNESLVWDRLPIAAGTMALFSAFIAEQINRTAAKWLSGPLILLGLLSVVWWSISDDLRLYGLVTIYPIIGIPLMLWLFPRHHTANYWVYLGLLFYVFAKLCEVYDWPIYETLNQTIGGHPMKHVASAIGVFCLIEYLVLRKDRDVPQEH